MLARAILCCLAVSVGLLAIGFAGVGIYQLREVATSQAAIKPDDYRVLMFVWELLDDPQQPGKPAETAAKVSRVFWACGLAGVFMVVMGIVALAFKSRERQQTR